MRYLKGFYMALGMFCAIPLPFHVWDVKLTAVMVAALPLVGAIIGAIWWAAGLLLVAISPPLMLAAAMLTIIPFLIAGFIHLDGFMDTSDALLSRRDARERLRILKDPHVGAFAVIMLVILFLLQFAAAYSIIEGGGRYLALLIVICILSRGCSALCILVLRHMPESNYAAALGQKTSMANKIFVIMICLGAIAAAALYAGLAGLIVSAVVLLSYGLAMGRVYKSFNGVSGDLLGYSMVISELCGLMALALLQGVTLWF